MRVPKWLRGTARSTQVYRAEHTCARQSRSSETFGNYLIHSKVVASAKVKKLHGRPKALNLLPWDGDPTTNVVLADIDRCSSWVSYSGREPVLGVEQVRVSPGTPGLEPRRDHPILSTPSPTQEKGRGSRRRFQYSIRSLLAAMVLVAGAMSWFSVKLERAREQRRTVEAIIRLGGTVGYDFDFNPAGRGQTSKWLMVLRPSNAAPARWLCDWFGDRLSFRRLGG